MVYDIWDADSGNIVGAYASRNEALAVLRHALAEHGAAYVASLLLGQQDKRGRSKPIAQGDELLRLATVARTPGAWLGAR